MKLFNYSDLQVKELIHSFAAFFKANYSLSFGSGFIDDCPQCALFAREGGFKVFSTIGFSALGEEPGATDPGIEFSMCFKDDHDSIEREDIPIICNQLTSICGEFLMTTKGKTMILNATRAFCDRFGYSCFVVTDIAAKIEAKGIGNIANVMLIPVKEFEEEPYYKTCTNEPAYQRMMIAYSESLAGQNLLPICIEVVERLQA